MPRCEMPGCTSVGRGQSLGRIVDFSGRNFGLLIAYVIPGFIALWGLSWTYEPVRLWLQGAAPSGPTFGGALYVVMASVACGLIANAFRWVFVDQLHHRTGLPHPDWDDSHLQEHLEAFDYLVENHYRFYQFYGASLVATLAAYAAWRLSGVHDSSGRAELIVSVLTWVFLVSSRDALTKYYSGTALLLGTLKENLHDERTPPSRTQATGEADPGEAEG